MNEYFIRNLNENGRLTTLACKHNVNPSGQPTFAIYRHASPPFFGVNYVVAGQGTYIDTAEQEYPIRPGSVFLRLPDGTHSTLLQKGLYEEWCLTFDTQSYGHLTELGIVNPKQPFLQLARCETLPSHFQSYLALLRNPDVAQAEIMLNALELLIELQRRAQTVDDPWDELVRKAGKRLAENPEQRISAEKIARELGVGYHTFRRIFRERTGFSPADYRIRCRMDAACNLLITHSVKETAERLGYPDPYTFSEQFKRFIGMPPRQYRHSQL